jgi:negative regulator of replication initiation
MNFYIGDSIEKLNLYDNNVEIDDELYEYIYQHRNKFINGVNALLRIDRFSDTLIHPEEVKKLRDDCRNILELDIINQYKYYNEANNAINELIDICNEAYSRRSGLISIGD